eukprot:3615109-Rhodomonas_salina.1
MENGELVGNNEGEESVENGAEGAARGSNFENDGAHGWGKSNSDDDDASVDAGADDVDCATIEEDLEKYGGDDMIAEALASEGANLRQYVKRIEGDLRKVERESIADYVRESENLAQLHMKIRSCDEVLGNMQDLLGTFQGNLGKVSAEIKTLQERAGKLSVKAKNRKLVDGKLSRFVDGAG